MAEKFAVLIPAYNGADCIGDALESIIRWCEQSLQAIPPVYVFDDCSRDETVQAALKWQSSLPLHVVRNQQNLGEAGNVNHAMSTLRSLGFEWVMLLHQDDLLAGPWIQTSLELIETADPSVGLICCGNLYSWDQSIANAQLVPRPEKLEVQQHPGTLASIQSLHANWFWTVPGSVFRIAAFMEMGGLHPLLQYAGDNDFLVRFMQYGHGTLHVPWPAILKRHFGTSQTARANESGSGIVCWSYLMLKYLPLSSKTERTGEFLKQAKNVSRRAISMARRRRSVAARTQLVSLGVLVRSYIALITGIKGIIPAQVRPLLDFVVEPLPLKESPPAVNAALNGIIRN